MLLVLLAEKEMAVLQLQKAPSIHSFRNNLIRTAQWRRPEDITTPNVVTTIDDARPGSDLAGSMAAALAAASVVFKDAGDLKYSEALLSSAKKAYAHAVAHKGVWYNAAVPDGASFYPSSNSLDDVAWATVWLSIRTGDAGLRPVAKELYYDFWKKEDGPKVWNNFGAFFW
jgi:hypothetical protein